MGKGLRVVIVGLPLFSKKLAENLSQYDPENSYLALDTYYNKWDKVKARFKIPNADVVYSINGSLTRSRVFDLALAKDIPLIMNWVGTDVLKSLEAFRSGNYMKDYIKKAQHHCEVNWIQEELKETGIAAEVVNFAVFEKQFDIVVPEGPFTVLSYIPGNRSSFYGIEAFLSLANSFPDTRFLIAGGSEEDFDKLPANVKALGWVKDMGEVFDQSHVCVRYPEHDGLSNFILEAMARGKQVLYKYNFDHCNYCPTENDLIENLSKIKQSYDSGKWEMNKEAVSFIQTHFNRETILGGLVKRFKEISGRS